MNRHFWRRFRPQRSTASTVNVNNFSVSRDIFQSAEQKIYSSLPRNPHLEKVNSLISQYFDSAKNSGDASSWIAALAIQSPRASLAQQQMDKHKHGYHNKQVRLYELIDFNDTFVAAVLATDSDNRRLFSEKVRQICDHICDRTRVQKFSDEQWLAITRGLSREIAVYLAARDSGFEAVMTSRRQDALGVDIQIKDPQSKRYINIDCKTPSAFRYRLDELAREGRVSRHDIIVADREGYVKVINGHGNEKIQVIILAILPDFYGDIENFEFKDTQGLREKLNLLIREHGISGQGFGEMKEIITKRR